MPDSQKKHLLIPKNSIENIKYTPAGAFSSDQIKVKRERKSHADKLLQEITAAVKASKDFKDNKSNGTYLEFFADKDSQLPLQSLELKGKISLCNVQIEDGKTKATIFLPTTHENYFDNKISAYKNKPLTIESSKIFPKYHDYRKQLEPYFADLNQKKLVFNRDLEDEDIKVFEELNFPTGLINTLFTCKPQNANLLANTDAIALATIDSLWTDKKNLIPDSSKEWCEVWLKYTNKTEKSKKNKPVIESNNLEFIETKFKETISELNIELKEGGLYFPERIVKLVHVNKDDLENLSNAIDSIAEFRKASTTSEFWLSQNNKEQTEWVEDLLSRTTFSDENNVSICILDNGVNNGHTLLAPLLPDSQKHTVDSKWGSHDQDNHGTNMAGIAGYNNLATHLESDASIHIQHTLESVKILPNSPEKNPPELWGDITQRGIAIAEIAAPQKKRVICMAVTGGNSEKGMPTSWSGAIDTTTSGASDEIKRLFIISAGNAIGYTDISTYPHLQRTYAIENPAQSWNALSIGSYTELVTITDNELAGYTPLANSGELSPFTTTSFTWDKQWPIKPEVVFEGGNVAYDDSGFVTECADLSLLTTSHEATKSQLTSFSMTSASTALAANFAAQLLLEYPNYWPETIRALIVHSARWTEGLKKQFAEETQGKKLSNILKAAGYGVPSLEKALYCANNYLTLITEQSIQPYTLNKDGNSAKLNEMILFELPWPKDALLALGEKEISMRVTLSYFIEPSPANIGWKSKYAYPSYRLCFDINSPTESKNEFKKRINKALREEGEEIDTQSASSYWLIGSTNRNKGSIHSDIWKGNAAELASSNYIAVFPQGGWWKERLNLNKANQQARFSLIVSIETEEQNVDIYTPVSTIITPTIAIET